ncbi:MAG: CDP-glucose 4,6-dehydratase [Chitinispirillales bacterium]|jgi:CDP-glucose 4,6-dehydratase|nr:CDP-glucose 4,6-dehydratase [Chitinispirillales bacterium]
MLDFYKNKTVFITGHTGFKGSWLCRVLKKAGAKVIGSALEPNTSPSLFSQIGIAKGVYHCVSDIRTDSFQWVAALHKPDIVVHMAAQPLVRESYEYPRYTYQTNVMGTVNILEAVRASPTVKSFVNVTTDKVYENKERAIGYREDENLCGYDPYSNSKSCSELVTYSYRQSFFSGAGGKDAPAVSTARSGNVIGGGDYAKDRIIPDCVRAATSGREIAIRNPQSTRPYQHVLECLYGYLLLAKMQYEDRSLEGAYNFGPDDGSCVTNGELVDLFCAAWGKGASWRAEGGGGPHEANFLKLDISKSKAVLGWKPMWGIKTAVEKVVEFAKAGTDEERIACVDRQIGEYFGGV